ncbi:DUF1349 domain-containing protein [Metapseudomonas lalkuanensis]|uniref:DUF1349 domain-containing protein n=1 Tax=Metapseudomonas lalkuanensis TaxID=2604832 RepID=A0A5J6QR90_9GAMM|nr:DUF1349 domain-containing protein [Pseudomonas lalkuanensis]QEY64252.1 DUF1349 domain-containing protein [Pseudomonas lalkuanensis]
MNDSTQWRWLNEPATWRLEADRLTVVTDANTDFWQETWYGFRRQSGHVYGCDISGDFTFELKVEGDFTELYDQAGLMLMLDERCWLKAAIEFNDSQPMISSVLTNPSSDWAPGIFPGDAGCFWLRLTLKAGSLRLQYSTDGLHWPLLRLCAFPSEKRYFVGAMCCTPERQGLAVTFSEMRVSAASDKTLHDLS